jgi:hypothetical protein
MNTRGPAIFSISDEASRRAEASQEHTARARECKGPRGWPSFAIERKLFAPQLREAHRRMSCSDRLSSEKI